MSSILSPLTSLLECVATWVVAALAAAITTLVNLLVAGLMALLGPALALLPEVSLAEVDLPPFLAQANWVFPLDQFVIALGVVTTVLVAWHLVSIVLRWLKAIE